MRGPQGGVLGPLGKFAERGLSPEEQNIAVRGRGEPAARAQAFEPGSEIRQEQAGSV